MNLRLTIFALVISILLHVSVMFLFGRLQIQIPSFDFIYAYVFEGKRIAKDSPKLEQKIDVEHARDSTPSDTTKEEYPKEAAQVENPEDVSISQSGESYEDLAYSERENQARPNGFTRFINEKMKFDIYWMGIYAGFATMRVTGDGDEIRIITEVHSSPFISNFYYVNDRAESTIYRGKPRHFYIKQIEGKYRGHKETHFNYESGEITFINHIKNKVTVHRGVDRLYMDLLTGFYFVRTQPIGPENSVFVDIFDSDKFGRVEVKAIREEVIETELMKEVNSILIKPELLTEGLFRRRGDIYIWLSNDERKIPLRVETKISAGKVTAELREYSKE